MPKSNPATVLSACARLVGDMTTDEEVVLAGTFEGTLRTSRSLQIAPTGCLKGEIHAGSVFVLGRVTGPIIATDRIELQPGARVDGDVSAQQVRIHEDVVFNGHCCITGPESSLREYLVPAVVQVLGGDADPGALDRVERATEGFLSNFGFDIEVRPESARAGSNALRPIFRSRDALPYVRLRERLRFVERALQTAAAPDSKRERFLGLVRGGAGGADAGPLQTTGADAARALVEAVSQLRDAALMLGPIILTHHEADEGARVAVRTREDSMPPETAAAEGTPDPGSLLLCMQKVQNDVARELLAAASESGARLHPHV